MMANVQKQHFAPTGPLAGLPFSNAVRVGNIIYTAGMLGVDPSTGKLAGEDIRGQTRQTLDNLKAALGSAGGSLSDVVKTTVYLTDWADYVEFNKIYQGYFSQRPPARATVAVRSLALNARIEIEAIAITG